LQFVKALGFELSTRGLVQVSMNLVNYESTGMTAAYNAVRDETTRLGVGIVSTEIVGLVPQNAIDREGEYFQKLENFSEDKILENRLRICG
jgi:glutamate formiminotransferase